MKKFLCLALLAVFCFQAHSVWAQSNSLCPEKVLDSGNFEGIFLGVDIPGDDCEEMCGARFQLDNGEVQWLLWGGEEDAEKYFGAEGNKVSVDYEIIQFVNPGGECSREGAVKNGRIIAVGAGLEIIKKREEQER